MDNLRSQMVDLMQGIAASARERHKSIGTIKKETADALRTFGRERVAAATALQADLAAGRQLRVADVQAIRANAGSMCEDFRQERGHMCLSLRQSLDQSRGAVVGAVGALRASCAKGRSAFAKAYRQMAKAQRTGLSKAHREHSRSVVALMGGFSQARHQMAKAQRTGLIQGRRQRSQAVGELVQGFFLSREKMADELANSLAASRQLTRSQLYGEGRFVASPLKASVVLAASQHKEQAAAPAAAEVPALMPEAEALSEQEEAEELHAKSVIGDMARHALGKSGKSKKKW